MRQQLHIKKKKRYGLNGLVLMAFHTEPKEK